MKPVEKFMGLLLLPFDESVEKVVDFVTEYSKEGKWAAYQDAGPTSRHTAAVRRELRRRALAEKCQRLVERARRIFRC